MALNTLTTISCLVPLVPLLAGVTWFSHMFKDRRDAVLAASIIWGITVTAVTESLSAFSALAFVPLLLAWAVLAGLSTTAVVLLRGIPRHSREGTLKGLAGLDSLGWVSFVGVGSILLATALVCLASPPNNWDSMTYHLARVANWIDHHSVRHYPTHILRQLYMGPWAEFTYTVLTLRRD